ncbi:MAG TPA: DUF190 domain-containing protein, partial [Roseiflexaceae bacterium]
QPSVVYQQAWIFLRETDQWQQQPLSLAILDHLRRAGITDATIFRDTLDAGVTQMLQQISHIELDGERGVAVTFVDRPERVTQVMPPLLAWLAWVTALAEEGEITVAPITVVAGGRRARSPFPAHLTVADVMRRDVVALAPETPVRAVIALLIDQALRSVVVVDAAGHVLGIVTDGDLLRRGGMDLPIDLRQALPLLERAAELTNVPDRPHRAIDVMTPDPITIVQTIALGQAAALMAEHDLKRLPVVDDQRRLVGMVSRADLLGTVAERLRQRPAEPLRLPPGGPATIGDIMLRDVPTAHRDTPLRAALDRLLETDKRRVVVVDDDRRVVGIMTDGDVIRRAARHADPSARRALLGRLGGGETTAGLEVMLHGHTIADVMTSPVVTIAADAPIAEAIRTLMAHRIKRMPIVDDTGRLVGLVGRAGLLQALSGQRTGPDEATP